MGYRPGLVRQKIDYVVLNLQRNIKGMLPAADIAAMRTLFEQVTHQRLFVQSEILITNQI